MKVYGKILIGVAVLAIVSLYFINFTERFVTTIPVVKPYLFKAAEAPSPPNTTTGYTKSSGKMTKVMPTSQDLHPYKNRTS